jgi:hypothetical protein
VKEGLFKEGTKMFTNRAGRRRGPTADELKAQKSEDEIKRLQEVVAELAAENIELNEWTGRS